MKQIEDAKIIIDESVTNDELIKIIAEKIKHEIHGHDITFFKIIKTKKVSNITGNKIGIIILNYE